MSDGFAVCVLVMSMGCVPNAEKDSPSGDDSQGGTSGGTSAGQDGASDADAGRDAATRFDAAVMDGATPANDAGEETGDDASGDQPRDSGSNGSDASPGADSAARSDGATDPVDAASDPVDAGPDSVDAGPTPMDAGGDGGHLVTSPDGGEADAAVETDAGADATDWMLAAGGTLVGGKYQLNRGHDVAVDDAGNAYVTGMFIGQGTFGSDTITCAGQHDMVVFKVSAAGDIVWGARAGGTNWDSGEGIALDADQNVYVTGYYQATADFGSLPTLTDPTTWHDGFATKLTSEGDFVWATALGNGSSDATEGSAIVVDALGNSFIAGKRIDALQNYYGLFKLLSTGALDWSGISGNWQTFGSGLTSDSEGGLWTTGSFSGSRTLVGMEADQDPIWDGDLGAPGRDIAFADGDLFVAGSFSGSETFDTFNRTSNGNSDVFVARVSRAGVVEWATTFGGLGDDLGNGIAVDSAGNSYVAGTFYGTVAFGEQTESAAGSNQSAFVAKLSPTGSIVSAVVSGAASGYAQANAIALDPNDQAPIVVGTFEKTVDFGGTTRTAAAGSDIFVWRLVPF